MDKTMSKEEQLKLAELIKIQMKKWKRRNSGRGYYNRIHL